jgi:hypothetical protein
MPTRDYAATLDPLFERGGDDPFRVLWIGDPEVLPLAGYRLGDDLAYGLSDDGMPDVVDRVATSPSASVELVADALRLVASGRSDRLGRLLAPFGIRYVVLLSSSAPERANGVDAPLAPGLEEMMSRQLDLSRIAVDPAVGLFESTAWMPVHAVVRGGGSAAIDSPRLFSTAASTDFSGAKPAVGTIDAGIVHLAVPYSSRWHLEVDGARAAHSKSLGWANRYEVHRGGHASFAYATSPARWLAVLAQVLLWVIAALVARRKPKPVDEPAIERSEP